MNNLPFGGSGSNSATSDAASTTTGSTASTTGSASTTTASSSSTDSGNGQCFSQCDAKCGGTANVISCTCANGQMDTVSCSGTGAETTGNSSGSSVLEVIVVLVIGCVAVLL